MISISLHIVHCDKILKHNTVYRLEVEYVNGDDGRIARYQQDGQHYTLLNAFGMLFFKTVSSKRVVYQVSFHYYR